MKKVISIKDSELGKETFAGFVEEYDIAKKRKFLNFQFSIFNFYSNLIKPFLHFKTLILNHIPKKYQILNTNRRRAFAGVFGIIIIFGTFFLQTYFQINPPKLKFTETNLPYQEKIADGVYELKNREPISQVLAEGPTPQDLALVENKQISKDPNKQMFRWSVTNANGTKFEFGLVDSQTPKGKVAPVVRVVNKEGYFVSYASSVILEGGESRPIGSQRKDSIASLQNDNNYVTPKVKGDIIEWEIADGIMARYTMMQDRVKADYIVNNKSSIVNNKLEFDVVSGNVSQIINDKSNLKSNESTPPSADDPKSSIINHQSLLKGELMPGGDIDWYTEIGSEESSQPNIQFTFPAPVVEDKNKKKIDAEYEFARRGLANSGASEYHLAIVLDEKDLENAVWPLIIDPVVIDSTAFGTSTAYGNGRKILRDPWGNLIVFIKGGTSTDDVYYKNYNSVSWVDAGITLGTVGGSYSTIDFDSAGNIHVIWPDDVAGAFDGIDYEKLTITRNSSNVITQVTEGTSLELDDTGLAVNQYRPSMIVANKGGGAGVEKVVALWSTNTISGGTIRGELRLMQCDVADDCASAANWKNASEEINGTGGTAVCSDVATSGAAGLPNTTTCKGTADKILATTASHTTHHAVLTQIPGKPKRSPASVQKDINGTWTNLSNMNDNNTGTDNDLNNLFSTGFDFLYAGDDKPFSKITADMVNTNSTSFAVSKLQYCSAKSAESCTTWTDVLNTIHNTGSGTKDFSEDGSFLFDEPSNWVTHTINGITGKYWIRAVQDGSQLDPSVSIAEIYITDRNSKALMVVGGVDSTDDLGASYIPWDEVSNAGWENNPFSVGAPWRDGITALDTLGGDWTAFTNFPLSAAVDYKNNSVYVGYVENIATDVLHVKYAPNNKDLSVAANWTDTTFPTVTEAADLSMSLTSDGSDIYLFYVLDAGTNSLVFRRCSPGGGGNGNTCDNSSDWGSEATLYGDTTVSHPQAVVTKVTGDVVAIDTLITDTIDLDVLYELHYVDLTDKTVVVGVGGDDAYHRDCNSGTDDQYSTLTSNVLGAILSDGSCDSFMPSKLHVGFHFSNITVAQGAAISSAYVDFTSLATNDISITVYGEDVDNSSTFSDLTNCANPCSAAVGVRTRTTNSYSRTISFTPNNYRLDVTDIVQEIVCRGAANSQPCVGDFNGSGTWASGNSLSIFLIVTSSNAVTTNINGFEATGTHVFKPTLQINVAPSGITGKNYFMGSATQLATGSASFTDFDHPFSASEFGAVATDDTNYASVSATTVNASQSAQPAFMFKVNNGNNNNTYKIDASAIVKSTLPTSSKPVYLQIYRGGSTNNWVTMASNNNTAADNDITFTSPSITSNLSEYYFNETPGIGTRYAACTDSTANCWTYWRVYQDAPTTSLDEALAIDYVNVSYNVASTPPTKIGFSNSVRSLAPGVCNGAAKVFTMELQDNTDTPTNPLASTVARVISNSDSYAVYSDNTCSTPVVNGDFTFATNENTKSVYIIDSSAITGAKILTGARQSGDSLTTGTQNYLLGEIPVRLKGGNRLRGGLRLR